MNNVEYIEGLKRINAKLLADLKYMRRTLMFAAVAFAVIVLINVAELVS